MTTRDAFASFAGDLDALAPSFGQARSAVERLAARAREGEPREILRAGRRVAEEIALGLAADAGSGAPRDAGLEALLARLDAGGGRLALPSHARAHLETLRRPDPGPKGVAGREEAFAALAAAIALLRWYAQATPETVVSVVAPVARGEEGRRLRLRAALVAWLVLLALAAAILVWR